MDEGVKILEETLRNEMAGVRPENTIYRSRRKNQQTVKEKLDKMSFFPKVEKIMADHWGPMEEI